MGNCDDFAFLGDLTKLSQIKVLIMEDLATEVSGFLPLMGSALAENVNLIELNMNFCKITK